ncbi:MAG TPA: tripartite tricarboxylate transporter substrate binding protein [Burkholderiales bacterium]|nr:tripartite tricarboxylate transporter substrate binding protein [Burkholderiales bacterium]
MKRRQILLAALASPFACPFPLRAQGISNRPVRFILGQTPATTPDLIARTLAPRMQARWHQPFVVENRGGAGGAIGLDAVAKSPPDGHVITISVNSTLTLPLFFKIDFDVLTSFTPICTVAQNIFALAVHPSVPAKSFAEFVEWAKKEGAKANYGSPGNGTHHHLIMESVKLRTGLQMTHIPYKGSAPAFADLMGGQISAMFVPLGTALSLGPSGRIRPLAGSAKERSPLAPDLPSLHELGVKDFDYYSWFSAWGPAGMAADTVAKYNAAFREVMGEPEVRDTLAKHGVSPRLSTPQELDRLNREDYANLAKLVKDAKIKGD